MDDDKSYLGAYAVKRRQILHRIFIILAAVVVFCTTYALILPAITLDKPNCGLEEHTHTESCYKTVKKIVCGKEQDENHIHTDECYKVEKVLTCTKPEHIHTDECYQKYGTSDDDSNSHSERKTENADKLNSSGAENPTETENNGDSDNTDNQDIEDTDNNEEKTSEVTDSENSKRAKKSAEASGDANPEDISSYTDLEEYLKSQGGEVSYTLYDKNNQSTYIYNASGSGYTFNLIIKSPKGIVPGSYVYKLPKELTNIYSQSIKGEITKGSGSAGGQSSIGTYEVSSDFEYIIFTFDEEANRYQNVTGRISLMVDFEEAMKQSISKSGYYGTKDGVMDGYFHFEINAKIPKYREGAPMRQWYIIDTSKVTKEWTYDFDNDNTSVYISYGDVSNREVREVRKIDEVYSKSSESIAYWVDPSSKALYLVNRCKCEDKNCYHNEDGLCTSLSSLTGNKKYSGWCTCWVLDEKAEVTIKYRNNIDGSTGENILANQSQIYDDEKEGSTLSYYNEATLWNSYIDEKGKPKQGSNVADVKINYSHFMSKNEIRQASKDNDYISTFSVVINKDKSDLSKLDVDGDKRYDTEVTLTDSMKNMIYIVDSMSITAEGEDGEFVLSPDEFSVKSTITDGNSDLVISLKKLGRYKYTLTYKAQLQKPESGSTIEFNNTVSIRLYDSEISVDNPYFIYEREFYYEDEWDYRRYEVNITKVDYHQRETLLEGAVYGIYTRDDTLIAEQTTDENGSCMFATDVQKGIIYQTDTLYYIKEISPPKGYNLDNTKHWFYFSENKNTALEDQLTKDMPNADITPVLPSEDNDFIGKMTLTDEELYTLPETGGSGTTSFTIAGLAWIILGAGCFLYKIKYRKGGSE